MTDDTNTHWTRRTVLKASAYGAGVASVFGTPQVTDTARGSAEGDDGQHVQTTDAPAVEQVPDAAFCHESIRRAVAAYDAMQANFYKADSQLYRQQYPEGDLPYSTAWPFSQALGGTIDLAGIRWAGAGSEFTADVEARLAALETYWNPDRSPAGYDSYVRGEYGPGGELFYDDNLWIGLELVRHYRMTGDEAALDRARQVFDLVVSAWVDDSSWAAPGGIRWKENSDSRNAVSNAPAAKLGLRLYQLTDDPAERDYYRTWAERIYQWVVDTLQAPDGLIWDSIAPDGSVTDWVFSYNQGTMIGTNVLLAEVTGDDTYLDRAETIADAALSYFDGDGFYQQDMEFNAIFFKNLFLLDERVHDPEYGTVLASYVDRIWNEDVDPDTNVVQRGAAGSPTNLLRQSALVQLCATRAWVKPDYDLF